MTTASISFGIKSQLAKLLATENITMQHNPSANTAYFNVETRELILPVWQNISEDLYDMLVVHEVGHALDTPGDLWLDAISKIAEEHHTSPTDNNKMAIRGYLNVIEDARIDKRQKRRYPGSKRNYVVGYKELHERDFFGIAKKDVNDFPFIDRINIHFKNGAALNIKFSEEEKSFIRRIENAETFDDVISITSDIYGYSAKKKAEKNQQKSTETSIDDDMMDELDQQSMYDQDIADDMDDSEESDDLDSSFSSYDSEMDDSDDMDDSDNSKIEKSSEMNDELEAPETEQAAQESAKNIVLDANVHYVYLNTPKMNHKAIVDDYKVVQKEKEETLANMITCGSADINSINKIYNELNAFKKSENETISFMVKEFEMKKSADEYSRTSISKTGVLDMNKVHSYKYNDDIFRKMTVVPNGKNHGFFMILDWSGSMLPNFRDTIKQVISLVLFCKKVQIPFEVYAFRNLYSKESNEDCFVNRNTEDVIFDNFKMRNILSSRMDINTLNRAIQLLWLNTHYRFSCDIMDSTPLNQAIMASDVLINDFRKRHKLQVVNTIIVTDGGSDEMKVAYAAHLKNSIPGHSYDERRYFLRDTVTKNVYDLGRNTYGHKTTEVLLKILKERTQSNVIGFFLSHSFHSVASVLQLERSYAGKLRKKFNTEKFVGIESAGYDEYYCLNVRDLNKQVALKVNPDMTQKSIIKEFMKYSDRKSTNRVMLSSFMNRVTKAA